MKDRLQHLFAVISGERFLKKQGLGNEVPFFICPFKPEETIEMERLRRQLINRLEQSGIRILEINLYDLSIELLQERGIWSQVLEVEQTVSKEEFRELLQGVLDPETHLVPAIAGNWKGRQTCCYLRVGGVPTSVPTTFLTLAEHGKRQADGYVFPRGLHAFPGIRRIAGSFRKTSRRQVLQGLQHLSLRSPYERGVMTLKNIFSKPIDRPIEGVIKADDETSLRLEIEEYVLTNEVEKRLESFLDAYNN